MEVSRSQDKGTWRSAPRGLKTTVVISLIFMLLHYLVYAVYISTRYHFSNPLHMAISDFLLGYYELAELLTPNQITMYPWVDDPPILGISLVGLLNLAVAFLIYIVMIRRRWRPLLVIPGYFVLSLVLWVVCLAL